MDLLKAYALSFVGVPYRYGGENPMSGLDCSGLVQHLLASCGMDPPGDQTAQGLYHYFSVNGSFNLWGCGALAFFGTAATKVVHVGMCLDNYRMIEAGGGDASITTLAQATSANAFVRIRPIKYRSDFLCVIKPFYRPIAASVG